jgi:FkbM family methyltransferase
MINNGKIFNEKELKRFERKLTKQFLDKKEFTKFEKETVRGLKSFILGAYDYCTKEFYRNVKENQDILNIVMSKLDMQSRNIVKSLIKELEYISTHHYADLIQDLFNKEEELMKYIEKVNSYKHLKLHANLYEESVFGHHHGLIYLPEKIIKSLRNKDFLDCGAYIGDSALIFEKYYNPKKIYSFEPDEESYNSIFETIKLNNLNKVFPIKLGVGSKDSIENFLHMSMASKITPQEGNYKIELTTVDKFVFDRNLDVGLIKMDVEGYAFEALKGAIRTIEEYKPVLLICIYHNVEEFINATKFVQDLKLEYNMIIRHFGGLIPFIETHLIAY